MLEKNIKVKLIKSLIGRKPSHVSSAKALGLKRINQCREIAKNKCNMGLIKKISYLLEIKNI